MTEIVTPYERSDKWCEKAAVRRRGLAVKRIEKNVPLFAPILAAQVPTKSGDELRLEEQASWDKCRAIEDAADARFLAAAAAYRADVAARVSPETMAQLDAWVATRGPMHAGYLAQPAYLADHWYQVRQRLDKGDAPIVAPVAPKRRADVDPDAVYAVIAAAPAPLRHVDIADRLGACVVLLDVIRVVLALRDEGRVVMGHRGFVAAERKAA